jgi:hypothetical protein
MSAEASDAGGGCLLALQARDTAGRLWLALLALGLAFARRRGGSRV